MEGRAAGLGGLERIDRVVVLMMENRSFDQMLGYLSLGDDRRDDVDGLAPGMANAAGGMSYPIHQLSDTAIPKEWDPPHEGEPVAKQIAGGAMSGFVEAFVENRPGAPPDVPMGYFGAEQVPVYDHLAEHFAICDRWFCSVPGATFPNRLYAVCGRADGSHDNRHPPVYDVRSMFHELDRAGVGWRWYSSDPGLLRLIDRDYAFGPDDRFAYFDRRTVFEHVTFLDEAKAGELPQVCWIDPNFIDLGGPGGANDDHPPADVLAGQALVLKVYRALATSPAWDTTLLLVVYDEHGGFFDHVPPPATEDDDARFRSLGPRVPALVISPLVEAGAVSHTTFDHTSIIKTILLRFADAGAIERMGARTRAAAHLGELLTRTSARAAPPLPDDVLDAVLEPRIEAMRVALREPLPVESPITGVGAPAALLGELRKRLRPLALAVRRRLGRRRLIPRDVPPPARLNTGGELEQELFDAFRELRADGLPPGKP